ncbi:hypothetical protein KR018_004778 [Drosophila ironensis]|nr:hypothetical protein KR018_004778 [Drosophila ironensis]
MLPIQNLKTMAPLAKLMLPTVKQLSSARVNALLLNVPRVQISSGLNNYLLLMIHMHGKTRFGRTIVRGSNKKTHADIFDEVLDEMDDIGICTKSLGGGFLDHRKKNKKIRIYGACAVSGTLSVGILLLHFIIYIFSKTFGEGDHARTKDILLSWTTFQNYNVSLTKGK